MIKASKLQNMFFFPALPFQVRENVCLRTSHPDEINIRSFENLLQHEFMSRKTFFFSLSNSLECFYSKKAVAAAHFAT